MEDAEDAIDDFAEIIENIGDKLEQGKCERILILILIKNNGYIITGSALQRLSNPLLHCA